MHPLRYLLHVAVMVLLAYSLGTSQEAPPNAPFGLKSGILTWKVTGKVLGDNTMTTTLYFDDYGLRQRAESRLEKSPSGAKGMGSEVSILLDSSQYIYHMGDSTGRLRVNLPFVFMLTVQETRSLINRFTFPMEHIQFLIDGKPHRVDRIPDGDLTYNGVKIKNTKIAGRDCKLYDYTHGLTTMKEAFWKGVPMRVDATEEGKLLYSITATNLKENVTLDDSLFTVPGGIVFTEEIQKQ